MPKSRRDFLRKSVVTFGATSALLSSSPSAAWTFSKTPLPDRRGEVTGTRSRAATNLHVEPMKEKGRFGVALSHPDFPGNIIRFRIPECWFSGLWPFWPPPGANVERGQTPNVRYPFIVLGPFSVDQPESLWMQRSDGSWVGHVELSGWWSCETTVTPGADSVLIRSSLANRTQWDWTEVWAHFCANTDLAPDFRDTAEDRTLVYLKDGVRPVNQTHHYEGVGWRTKCNTYVPIGREMLVKEYLYGTPVSRDHVASPLIIRQTANRAALVAVCFRHYYGLFYDCHPENNCLHSEPYLGDLESGETRTVEGHLYWFKGSVTEVAAKARQADHAWVP